MFSVRMTRVTALRRLERLPQRIGAEMAGATEDISKRMKRTARGYIGQERTTWAPLAARTVREKTRLGFTGRVSPTDPLLRRGTLKESIEGHSEPMKSIVESADPVAGFQELGTRGWHGGQHVPPRSFILDAARANALYALYRAARAVRAALRF